MLVRKITKEIKKKKLLSLVGVWKDSPEMDKIFKGILDERHKSKERGIKL